MLRNAKVLDDAVGELRGAIIRTVRTSTAEVDRRMFRRFDIDLPCRVDLAGQGVIAT